MLKISPTQRPARGQIGLISNLGMKETPLRYCPSPQWRKNHSRVLPDILVSRAPVQSIEMHDASQRWNDRNKELSNPVFLQNLPRTAKMF